MTVLEIVLTGLSGGLGSITGFFIVRYFNSQDKKNEIFFEMFKKNNDVIAELNSTLKVMQEHDRNFEDNCRNRHEEIAKKLEKIKAA